MLRQCGGVSWKNEKKTNWVFDSFNPSHPDPGQSEKSNLNFYFHTSLWCLKRF